LKAVGPSEH
jgi:hypothetical protein